MIFFIWTVIWYEFNCNLNQLISDQTLSKLKDQNDKLKKKTKSLNSSLRRQKLKVLELKTLLSDLKAKNLLERDPAAVIEQCFDGNILNIITNELSNSAKANQGKRYSQAVKQFATTLHYYSPQAYNYCRSILSLPHPSSIRNWLSNIECEPGFLQNVIDICSHNDIQDYSLVIDSMALMQQPSYSNGVFTGYCDYGGLIGEFSEKLCSEALVFLLVPLKFSQTQYPVGYFLVDKINSQIQAELIKTLLIITGNSGIKIRNITCDGAAANIASLNILNCTLDAVDPKPFFKHPVLQHNVYATLDICHMLKLCRNALAEMHMFNVGDQMVRWQYIEKLAELQNEIGLHFANKLSTQHALVWQKQKMKVKLAAQTFSRSVSDALQYLMENEQSSAEFVGCEATIEFIRQVSFSD